MRIEIVQPDPQYPMAYVNIYGVSKNKIDQALGDILLKKRITLLGPWEIRSAAHCGPRGIWGSFYAPGLLEDEHVKPTKRRGPYKKQRKV